MAKPILVEIFADATQFNHELNKAAGGTRRFGAVAKTVGIALAGGLALGLEESVRAAIDAQDSQRRLEQAFKNVGLSADTYSKQIGDAESASRKLGFAGNEVRDSLGSLLTATHDVSAAVKDLGIAQDLARFKGIDLETATKTLTGAMSGSQRALKTLGLSISPVTAAVDALKASHEDLSTAAGKADLAQAKLADKMATGQAVIAATSQLVRGQSQAYSETAAGGMARFSAELDNIEVTIGTQLLPALTALLTEANNVAAFLSTNLGPVVQRLTSFLKNFEGVARILGSYLQIEWRAIFAVWRAEIAAGIAVVNALRIALEAMRTAATAVAGFFTGAFHAAVTAARAVVSALDTALDGVRGAFSAVRTAAGTVAGLVGGGLTTTLNAFKAVANAVAAVIHAIASALNAAASAARSLAGALSSIHVPHISLPHIGLPHIPHTATGGIVTGPQIRLVGEAGPEAIIPLNSSRAGGYGGTTVNVYVAGSVVSEQDLAATVRKQLLRTQKRTGSLGFT